jgi:hypothetical protein
MSTKPLFSACTRQPPSSSGSIGLLIASDVTRALAIAIVEPLRMMTKSDIAAYQVDDP